MNQRLFIIIFLIICRNGYSAIEKTTSVLYESDPPLLFEIRGLGNGYSSPTISDNNFFITGEIDSIGYLFSYDFTGKLNWKTTYGKEWATHYPGSRSTPTVIGDLIYTCSGMGDIACFNLKNGEKKWSLNLINDLGGINISFGYSMPLVIDDDKLFCSPGGEQNNIVALNRFTGNLIWSSPAKGESPGYGDPIVLTLGGRKLLVTSSEFAIMGLDANTGILLWSHNLSFKGNQLCNKPIFDGTNLYWVAGRGNGAVAVKPSEKGNNINIIWKNIEFDTYFGGFVKMGDYLYGSSDSHRKYVSVNAKTGVITDSLSFGIGSTILADNMLIFYNQQGKVGLIRPNQEHMELVSSFIIQKGTNEHFSHPVYNKDMLFIRHGDVLLTFNVKGNE